MSFLVSSHSSDNSTPTGMAKINRCEQLKMVGNCVNFQVNQLPDGVVVRANTVTSLLPPNPPVISDISIDGNSVTIMGSVLPGAEVIASTRGGPSFTTRADSVGRFEFTRLEPPSGGLYTLTSNGVSTYFYNAAFDRINYRLTITDYYYRDRHYWSFTGRANNPDEHDFGPYTTVFGASDGSWRSSLEGEDPTSTEFTFDYNNVGVLRNGSYTLSQSNNKIVGWEYSAEYEINIYDGGISIYNL